MPTELSEWRVRLSNWDRQWLMIPKLIYFFLNCTIYATHNYTAMYFFKKWELKIHQFGIVSSLSAISFVGALFWGHLADKSGKHKSILMVNTILYGFFFCLLEFSPFDKSASATNKIIYSAVMYGASSFFVACLFPLVDAQIFSVLARDPSFTKETFGRQRLWGTIGHGLITLGVGYSIDNFGYIGMFVLLIASCTFFLFSVYLGIPSDIKIVEKPSNHAHHCDDEKDNQLDSSEAAALKEPNASTPSGKFKQSPAVQLLLNPHFFCLALVILSAGYVRSVMSFFLGFYMQNEMNQSSLMVAIAIMFRMGSEIAIFFFNKQLLEMLGLHWMLVIAQVSGVLRVLAYSVLPPQGNWFYLSFAIELLKGTSTGCLISSAVRMANDIAPPNCANTAQSYIAGIYSGLSLAMGGAFGGLIIYLLPNNSVAGMFYVTFWLGLATLIICLFKYSIIDRAILVPNSWKKQSKNFS